MNRRRVTTRDANLEELERLERLRLGRVGARSRALGLREQLALVRHLLLARRDLQLGAVERLATQSPRASRVCARASCGGGGRQNPVVSHRGGRGGRRWRRVGAATRRTTAAWRVDGWRLAVAKEGNPPCTCRAGGAGRDVATRGLGALRRRERWAQQHSMLRSGRGGPRRAEAGRGRRRGRRGRGGASAGSAPSRSQTSTPRAPPRARASRRAPSARRRARSRSPRAAPFWSARRGRERGGGVCGEP